MAWVGIVIIIALLEYFAFGLAVARARGRYNCPAPATSGNEMFERYRGAEGLTRTVARAGPAQPCPLATRGRVRRVRRH